MNFLVRFASKTLVLMGNDRFPPPNCSENSLALFVRFFGFGVPFWLLIKTQGRGWEGEIQWEGGGWAFCRVGVGWCVLTISSSATLCRLLPSAKVSRTEARIAPLSPRAGARAPLLVSLFSGPQNFQYSTESSTKIWSSTGNDLWGSFGVVKKSVTVTNTGTISHPPLLASCP